MATQNAQVIEREPIENRDKATDVSFRTRVDLASRVIRGRFTGRDKKNSKRRVDDPRFQKSVQTMLKNKKTAQLTKKLTKGAGLKGIGTVLAYISGGVSFLVAIFGIISVLFIFEKETWASWFTELFTGTNFYDIGVGLYLLNFVIVLLSYGALLVFFSLLKANPLKTMSGFLLTIFCLAFDVIFAIQILPWFFLWVMILAYTPIGKE